ncbi:hypothetical protein K2X33_12595, partial [bacterium]|nr:hypothetical protein [bacterium]
MQARRSQLGIASAPAPSSLGNHEKLLKKIQARMTPVGVLGLGYVGLPLACHLARTFKIVGFDRNARRIG